MVQNLYILKTGSYNKLPQTNNCMKNYLAPLSIQGENE